MKIGLLGYPLKNSLSKNLYQTISNLFKIEINFFEIETKEPLKEIKKLKKENFNGFFVTIPYKKVFFKISKNDEIAQKTKNVNCIKIENNYLISTNTDYLSLRYLIEKKGINPSNKKATIIGSGSSALTSYVLLKEFGVSEIDIIIRKKNKKEETQRVFKESNIILLSKLKNYRTDLLINATPLGMYFEFPQINFTFETAIDFAYSKDETILIKKAKKDSKIFIDGKEILVMQGLFGLKHIANIELKDKFEKIYQSFLTNI